MLRAAGLRNHWRGGWLSSGRVVWAQGQDRPLACCVASPPSFINKGRGHACERKKWAWRKSLKQVMEARGGKSSLEPACSDRWKLLHKRQWRDGESDIWELVYMVYVEPMYRGLGQEAPYRWFARKQVHLIVLWSIAVIWLRNCVIKNHILQR